VRPPGAFSVALLSAFRHWSIDRHDISVRSGRQKKQLADSEPLLHPCFSYVAAPEKVKPFGWLAQCLLFHLKQLITTEEFCAASPFLQTFPINTSCPVSKRFTLAMGLALYLGRS
jgi:hypothetical protein